MRSCELCDSPARMYCDSDQASLCWDCDLKVHGANFLVARHSRTLLCHVCQSPTPWTAAGAKLGPTLSICGKCSGDDVGSTQAEERDFVGGGDVLDLDDDLDGDSSDESEAEEEEDDEDEEEDDGENQVVPASGSPSDGNSYSCSLSLKRNRENSPDLLFQENINHQVSSTSDRDDSDPQSDGGIKRPLKDRRTGEPIQGQTGLIESTREIIERGIASGKRSSAGIAGLLKLSRDPEAV